MQVTVTLDDDGVKVVKELASAGRSFHSSHRTLGEKLAILIDDQLPKPRPVIEVGHKVKLATAEQHFEIKYVGDDAVIAWHSIYLTYSCSPTRDGLLAAAVHGAGFRLPWEDE